MEEYNGNLIKKHNYRELQAIAKKLGLPGNLKHHLLFEVIKARECGNENVVQKILSEQKLERARRKSEKLEGKDAGYKHLNIFQEKKRGPRPKVIKEPEKLQQFHHYETQKAPRKPISGPDSYLRSLLALPHHSLRELVIKNHQESVLRAKKMREAALGISGYQVDNTGAHCSTQVITEFQNPYALDNNIKYSTNFSDGIGTNIGIENLQSTNCNALQPRADIQDPFLQYYPSYMTTTTTTNENIIPSFIPDVQSHPEYSCYPSNQIQHMPCYQENSYSHDFLKVDNNNIQCIQNNPMYTIRQNFSPNNSDTMSASEPEFEQIYTNNEMHYVYPNQNQVDNLRNNEMQICYPSYNYQVSDNELMINQPSQGSQIVFESEVQDYSLELQPFTPISPDPLYSPTINNGVSSDLTLLNIIDRQEYQEWSYEYTAPDNTLNYVHGITHASYFQFA